MRRFFIFMIPLCTLFFNCSQGNYGNFLFSFNDYNSGVIFEGVDADVKTETFYIPETVYGIPVVEIKESIGKIYTKKVVLPNSVVEIGYKVFKSDSYPNLEEIIIKGDIQYLETNAFDSTKATKVVFASTNIPPSTSLSVTSNCIFYVPDESLYLYQTTYAKKALQFFPISEYSGNLSTVNIDKPDWNYEIEKLSPSWYYYDASIPTYTGVNIVLTNGVFHSEPYHVSYVSNRTVYLNFIYKPNTIICDLKLSSENDKPTALPNSSDYSRIYVYSETPVKIIRQSNGSYTSDGSYTYPGYEMTKIN
ncbi:MAG: hypothetical protein HDR53_03140 [Treponema sp.]|nr:hypothetical protein [Treponema sp.]